MPTTSQLSDADFRRLLLTQLPRLKRCLSGLLRGLGPRYSPQDADDLLQEVLLTLLREGSSVVVWWQAERGPIERSILLVAERAARSYLRSGRRSGWAEIPTDDRELPAGAGPDFEGQLIARRELRHLAAQLELRFGARAANVLAAWINDQASGSTCAELGLSPNALYCLRRRLKRAATHDGSSVARDSNAIDSISRRQNAAHESE